MHDSLETTLASLPSITRELHTRLGWWPGRTVDADVASAALHCPRAQAEAHLRLMENAELLTATADGLWSRSPQVLADQRRRVFRDLTPGQLRQLARRIGDHLLAVVETASEQIAPERPHLGSPAVVAYQPQTPALFSRDTAWAWLTQQMDTITSVATQASDAGWHALAWRLVDGLWPLVEHATDQRRHAIDQLALRVASFSGDLLLIAESSLRRGTYLVSTGDYAAAQDHLSRACDLFSDIEREEGSDAARTTWAARRRVTATEQLAQALLRGGAASEAVDLLRTCWLDHQRLGSAAGTIARAQHHLAAAMVASGDLALVEQAGSLADQSWRVLTAIPDLRGAAHAQITRAVVQLALATWDRGDLALADDALADALTMIPAEPGAHTQRAVLGLMAEVADRRGDPERARALRQRFPHRAIEAGPADAVSAGTPAPALVVAEFVS